MAEDIKITKGIHMERPADEIILPNGKNLKLVMFAAKGLYYLILAIVAVFVYINTSTSTKATEITNAKIEVLAKAQEMDKVMSEQIKINTPRIADLEMRTAVLESQYKDIREALARIERNTSK